jgi:S-adenosylmethionine decarboxylase
MPDETRAAVTTVTQMDDKVTVGPDFFIEKDGVRYAGCHLLVDLWGARGLTDTSAIESTLKEAARVCNATSLHSHLHQFGENGGVSGVIVLAESHISIHTWPERDFAAIDIFMCGSCDPYQAISVLQEAFEPQSLQLSEHRRGLTP